MGDPEHVDDDQFPAGLPADRGRMQSFVTMSSALAGFGTFLAGMLSELVGVRWAVGGMAIMLLALSLVYLAFARRVTRLD